MSFRTFFAENRHRSYVVLLVNVPEHDHRFSDTATSKDPGVGREKQFNGGGLFLGEV